MRNISGVTRVHNNFPSFLQPAVERARFDWLRAVKKIANGRKTWLSFKMKLCQTPSYRQVSKEVLFIINLCFLKLFSSKLRLVCGLNNETILILLVTF